MKIETHNKDLIQFEESLKNFLFFCQTSFHCTKTEIQQTYKTHFDNSIYSIASYCVDFGLEFRDLKKTIIHTLTNLDLDYSDSSKKIILTNLKKTFKTLKQKKELNLHLLENSTQSIKPKNKKLKFKTSSIS